MDGEEDLPGLDHLHFSSRSSLNSELKVSLAHAALGELPAEGDVFVAAGSTLAEFASFVPNSVSLTFTTSSVEIAATLARKGTDGVVILGGVVREDTLGVSATSNAAFDDLGKFDVCFLSANSLTNEGLFVTTRHEATLHHKIRKASKRCVVLLDASKINYETSEAFASLELEKIDLLITNLEHTSTGKPAGVLRSLRRREVDVWHAEPHRVLGIDIGSSGIRAAIVDTGRGLIDPREREQTKLRTKTVGPPRVVSEVSKLVANLNWTGPVGIAFPGKLEDGKVLRSATFLHSDWSGVNAQALFESVLVDSSVVVVNDAKAAAVAETAFGEFSNTEGKALVLLVRSKGVGYAILDFGSEEIDSSQQGVTSTTIGHDALNKVDAKAQEWVEVVVDFVEETCNISGAQLVILAGGGATRDLEARMNSELRARSNSGVVVRSSSLRKASPEIGASKSTATRQS